MKLFELSPNATMRELIYKLNQASEAYYNGREIMTNYEYDKLLAELQNLEKSTGIILSNSPSVKVGYPVKVDKLQKVEHEFPALSLDKTKDVNQFIDTFKVHNDSSDEVVLMWKLDGCTLQLTYDNGQLTQAVTRGDGYVGQDVTENAEVISGIPLQVNDSSKFTVRGEVVISYKSFESINKELPDDKKFKNPRNLASASLSVLDTNIVKSRHLQFFMFELVDHPDLHNMSFYQRLLFGQSNWFSVVPFTYTSVVGINSHGSLKEAIESEDFDPKRFSYPVDGLVAAYNDTAYTDGLEGTSHHPNVLKGYALKWADELKETILRSIEWSPSRTGLLNPVAVFDPVIIDGTTVSRASLHNFSIMRKLHVRIGDRINVMKSNLIIPQVAENLSNGPEYDCSDIQALLGNCPSCGSKGSLRTSKDGIESVYCENPNCSAKLIYKFVYFCSRECMDIEGLSESTITKFVSLKYIEKYSDIYSLDKFKYDIINIDGFGEKSWTNLWSAIQSSRNTTFVKFISAVSIPNIGRSQAAALGSYFNYDIHTFLNSKYLDFSVIDGIGPIVSKYILTWLHDTEKQAEISDVIKLLKFDTSTSEESTKLLGKKFVITGKLYHYKNRKQLEDNIRLNGGEVISSVSSTTDYLINNDLNSTSSKNMKAKELNVPIISEEDYLTLLS